MALPCLEGRTLPESNRSPTTRKTAKIWQWRGERVRHTATDGGVGWRTAFACISSTTRASPPTRHSTPGRPSAMARDVGHVQFWHISEAGEFAMKLQLAAHGASCIERKAFQLAPNKCRGCSRPLAECYCARDEWRECGFAACRLMKSCGCSGPPGAAPCKFCNAQLPVAMSLDEFRRLLDISHWRWPCGDAIIVTTSATRTS
jgi:hypothetical protein